VVSVINDQRLSDPLRQRLDIMDRLVEPSANCLPKAHAMLVSLEESSEFAVANCKLNNRFSCT